MEWLWFSSPILQGLQEDQGTLLGYLGPACRHHWDTHPDLLLKLVSIVPHQGKGMFNFHVYELLYLLYIVHMVCSHTVTVAACLDTRGCSSLFL